MFPIRLLITLIIIFSCQYLASQNQFIFGDSLINEKGIVSHQLPDGSIWIGGSSMPDSNLNMDVMAVRIDTGGNILSPYYTYGTNYAETPNNLIYQNGRLIIAGEQYRPNNLNAFILVIDTTGIELSFQSYGQPNQSEQFFDIEPTLDGGFVVSGFSSAGIGNDFLIGKFDSLQQLEWLQSYDLASNESGVTILENPNGGYIIAGDQLQFFGSFYNVALLGLDASGSVLWNSVVSSPFNSGCKSMVSIGDEILIVGETETSTSTLFDIFLARVDWFGNVKWKGSIPQSDNGDACFDASIKSDNEFVLTGYSYSTINQNTDIFVISVDSLGTILSEEYFNNGYFEMGYNIQPNLYGGFITTGFTFDPSSGDSQIFVSFPEINLNTALNQITNNPTAFNLYPNPTKSKIFLPEYFIDYDFKVFDILGKEYFCEKSNNQINFQHLIAGVYFVIFSNKSGSKKFSRKVVKE